MNNRAAANRFRIAKAQLVFAYEEDPWPKL